MMMGTMAREDAEEQDDRLHAEEMLIFVQEAAHRAEQLGHSLARRPIARQIKERQASGRPRVREGVCRSLARTLPHLSHAHSIPHRLSKPSGFSNPAASAFMISSIAAADFLERNSSGSRTLRTGSCKRPLP